MANYNKITVNDEVIIDLTQDTITKEKVPSGLTFHDKSGAVQTGTMTAQGAKTITPSISTQTAVPSGVYTTGAVTVAPIPSSYEDVTNETNTYTEKLEQLTTAITALEEELAGKASGGADGIAKMCTITVVEDGPCEHYQGTICYITPEGHLVDEDNIVLKAGSSFSILKNSLLIGTDLSFIGACEQVALEYSWIPAYYITGDCSILANM